MGLTVTGATSAPGSASHNTVVVKLLNCVVTGNQGANFVAWAAISDGGVAGFANRAIIELRGSSKLLEVEGGDSKPADPSGSNTLTIIR